MADPFTLLVDALIQKKSITLLNASGGETNFLEGSDQQVPEYISFNTSLCFLLTCPVPIACRNAPSGNHLEGFYSIGAVYFLYLKQNSSFTEYLRECRLLNWPHVAIIDRKTVLQALSGATESLTTIDMSPALLQMIRPRSIDEIKETLSIPTFTPLAESIEREKLAFHPNSPFLSRNKNYSGVVSMLRSLLKPSSSATEESSSKKSASANGKASGLPTSSSTSSLLPMELSSVNPRQLLDRMKGTKSQQPPSPLAATIVPNENGEISTKNYPIILVPFSSKAIINMFNVKEFLENHRYFTPDEARIAANGKKASLLTINRKKGANETLSYFVTDSASKLRSQDWKRVIAVFAQGATWQFKDWPSSYDNPAQLFSIVQGFHIKDEEETLDSKVREWNVMVLNIHKRRPHLDLESVVTFWNKLDSWMNSRGLIHSATGGFIYPY